MRRASLECMSHPYCQNGVAEMSPGIVSKQPFQIGRITSWSLRNSSRPRPLKGAALWSGGPIAHWWEDRELTDPSERFAMWKVTEFFCVLTDLFWSLLALERETEMDSVVDERLSVERTLGFNDPSGLWPVDQCPNLWQMWHLDLDFRFASCAGVSLVFVSPLMMGKVRTAWDCIEA